MAETEEDPGANQHLGDDLTEPEVTYERHPEHVLYGIPMEILRMARRTTRYASITKDIDPNHSRAIADSVVGSVAPLFKLWLSERDEAANKGAPWATAFGFAAFFTMIGWIVWVIWGH